MAGAGISGVCLADRLVDDVGRQVAIERVGVTGVGCHRGVGGSREWEQVHLRIAVDGDSDEDLRVLSEDQRIDRLPRPEIGGEHTADARHAHRIGPDLVGTGGVRIDAEVDRDHPIDRRPVDLVERTLEGNPERHLPERGNGDGQAEDECQDSRAHGLGSVRGR